MDKKRIDMLAPVTILLLCICSVAGILSMDFSKSYDFVNQYGDRVAMFGSGIYAGDTFFSASINIGTDFCILLAVVPLFILAFIKKAKDNSNVNKVNLMALYGVAFYYSTSVALGIKYNQLILIYIALLGCSLFGLFKIYREIHLEKMVYPPTRGLKVFLVISGLAIAVAWMADIIFALFSGRPPELIGVYTTVVTYVVDLGIIAPLCLICLHLLNRKDPLGTVTLAGILKLCIVIGIMMLPQTAAQYLAGIEVPLPVLITKSASFLALGGFAYYFERKLYASLRA